MHLVGGIVVLISGSGSNMDALVRATRAREVPADVVAVFADRACAGIDRARSLGIPAEVVAPSSFEDRDEWSAALRNAVLRYSPDLVVSAGFMRILAPAFVDAFEGWLINLHPALLPSFKGPHAVRDALAAGVTVTGSTVHFVDHQVDHGPIILQQEVAILPGDDESSLHERIKEVEHILLPKACRLLLSGEARLEGARVEEKA